jgi:Tfp pilus assembly protein PilF/4-amino-4-deoxy-L-arabinose transferase-like glycosyltransferase
LRTERTLLTHAVVFAVGLGVRLLHVWQMRDTLFFSVLMGDSRGYDAWARQVAAGDWIGREVFYQAPLYPYFLASLYWLAGHDLLVVRLVQALLGAGACVALSLATTRLFSPRAGVIAGLMLALYPPAIFFDGLIQKSVLDVFLVCVTLAIAARIGVDGERRGWWVVLGLASGALALTRENALVLAAVLVTWAFLRARRDAVMFAAGLAIALLPVAARNYAVGGGLYLTTSQFGSNLYIGNNPRADGSYMSLRDGRGSPEFERVDATALAEQAMGRSLSPNEVSNYWLRQTWVYVSSQPQRWLALLVRKARLLVSRSEVIDTESQESHAEYSWPLRVISRIWHFGVLLPLVIVGVSVSWRRRRTLTVFYALAMTYAVSVMVFYVVARYRLPLVPLLIPFAAAGLLAVLRIGPATLAAAVLAAVIANWPLHTAASQQAITENNLGAALQEDGRLDEAIARYRRALELDPDYVPAMNNLGTALRAAGRADDALVTYDKALTSGGAGDASIHLNRGNISMQQGRLTEAVTSFRQALALDPQSTHARQSLANALYDSGTAAIERGAFADAEAALREAIVVRPDYAEAHNNLGIALASQGRMAEAIAAWDAALRIDPSLADARRNLQLAKQR